MFKIIALSLFATAASAAVTPVDECTAACLDDVTGKNELGKITDVNGIAVAPFSPVSLGIAYSNGETGCLCKSSVKPVTVDDQKYTCLSWYHFAAAGPKRVQRTLIKYTIQKPKVDIQSLFADEMIVPDTLVVSNQFEFPSSGQNTSFQLNPNITLNQTGYVIDTSPSFSQSQIDPFQYFNDPEILAHLFSISAFVYFPFSVVNGNLCPIKIEEASLIYQKSVICNSIFFSIHPKLFPSALLGIPPTFQDRVNLASLIYMDSTYIKPKEDYLTDREMIDDFRGMFGYSVSLFGIGFPDRSLILFQETYILAMRYRLFNTHNAKSENITIDDLAKMVEFVDLQREVVAPDDWDNRLILFNMCLSSDTYISMISGVQFIVDDTLFDHYLEKLGPVTLLSKARRDFPILTVPNDYVHAENTIWQGTEYATVYENVKNSNQLMQYINAREFCRSAINRTKLYRRIMTFSRAKSKSVETKEVLLAELCSVFQLDTFEVEFSDLENFVDGELLVGKTRMKFPHIYTIPLTNLLMYCYLNQHEKDNQAIKPNGKLYPIKVIFTAVFNYLLSLVKLATEAEGVNPHLQAPTIIFLVYCIASSCLVKAGTNEMKQKISNTVLPVLDSGSNVWELCRTYASQMRRLLQVINF
ncbi:hypothetical protein HK103_002409 [Boothiomyces macroporosus]|uniref:Uncharacterized protein n=1 Tax=Boothiomyces macroporosus TaxID=261099 RepID=A0AAD5Y0D7_9FUNG|nr:hypothetical protein HK103_002409 [Boothiomyces macroporosus]